MVNVSAVVGAAVGVSHDVADVVESPLTAHISAYHEFICDNNQPKYNYDNVDILHLVLYRSWGYMLI